MLNVGLTWHSCQAFTRRSITCDGQVHLHRNTYSECPYTLKLFISNMIFGLLDKFFHKHQTHPRAHAAKAPSKSRSPLCSPISLQLRNEQVQSPLFSSNFPVELRLGIYEAVLGDQSRLMHIIPDDDGSGSVGRQRCEDPDCDNPTWQHRCFGIWLEQNGSTRVRQRTFPSQDKLLALLLTCHRMYVCSITYLSISLLITDVVIPRRFTSYTLPTISV